MKTRIAISLIVLWTASLELFGEASSGGSVIVRFPAKQAKGQGTKAEVAFRELERKLTNGTLDPNAQTLLQAADRFTRKLFQVGELNRVRSVTSTDRGDVLLVEWRLNGNGLAGLLILEDTPVYSKYYFHLSQPTLNSPEQLKALLERVVIYEKEPLTLTGLDIAAGQNEQGIMEFYGRLLRSATINWAFEVCGNAFADHTAISFLVGKAYTKQDYPVPPFVPERFPPLNESVASWATGRIKAEIGRPVQAGGGYPEQRDSVLIKELIRRVPTKEEFVWLLVGVDREQLSERAAIVLTALQETGQDSLFRDYFAPALAAYGGLGPDANLAADRLFRLAAHLCLPGVEPVALEWQRQGKPFLGVMSYLGRCSTSEETVRELESQDDDDPQAPFSRKSTARQIRERLRQQAN